MMREIIWLVLIFTVALLVRFLFFPDNVYFGYDQARDSYAALEIVKGHLKIIGPPSSVNDHLFHGPLIYYIYAPIYFLSHNNPDVVSFVFRIINALGLFLVFFITSILFNKKAGLMAAFLFAISFEQSQYTLYLSHPSLAVLPILTFYLGLALLFFKKQGKGLTLALLSLGLSIQFHYVNFFLFFGFILSLLFFYKSLKKLNIKWVLSALAVFLLSTSTFIIAEIKFHFREISALTSLGSSSVNLLSIKYVIFRIISDNFSSIHSLQLPLIIFLLVFTSLLLVIKSARPKIIFLIIWFIIGLIPYVFSDNPSYYLLPATSVSLVILISFALSSVLKKYFFIAIILILLLTANNLNLIFAQNKKGPNKDLVIQPGLFTSSEKKVLDFCYDKAQGQAFAAAALTIPLYINTTWSYLFEWYGQEKYGYVPIWGGKTALGYPGNLKVIDKRSNLPKDQCLIMEPIVGLSNSDKDNFLREEDYFSKVLEQKQFGTIIVQYRQKI